MLRVLRSLPAYVMAGALLVSGSAIGGAQVEEALAPSVVTVMSRAISDNPVPARYADGLQVRTWLNAMSPRLANRIPDPRERLDFLATVHYEATRAGLDPQLVLAVIDVESQFRKYAVSAAGARGLMQVMPFWVKQIGLPSHDLFDWRTNVRYGCTILRFYLDRENGNMANALGRYNGSLGRAEYPNRVIRAWRTRWSDAAGFNVKR